MEEAKLRSQGEDDGIDLEEKSKSTTDYNQKKVAQLKRVQELTAKIDTKWATEAIEVSLNEKDDLNVYSNGLEKRSTYSDMKNKKMMMFTITLPDEYLVNSVRFNFNSIDTFKSLYRIHNIEAYSAITKQKESFIRPLENQKLVSVDPLLKSITIHLYSFASSINIYYQQLNIVNDTDGRTNKKNKNLFTYHGPFHDLNAEIQKSNLQIQENDLDELDNEVAMISQKSPKGPQTQQKEDEKPAKAKDKDELNTRNFNSIPRNYNDNSESAKSGSDTEEGKKEVASENIEGKTLAESGSQKGAPLASITIDGARGMQSKINLIPLFNIKSLFLRNNRFQEALEIEYMIGLSLICSRRYVQALESFKRVQAKILKSIKLDLKDTSRGELTTEMFTKRESQDPKEAKFYSEMMRAASLEILIAECYNAQSKELEKIYSFKRATELYLGMFVEPNEFEKQEYYYEDVHSTLTKIAPFLIKMLLDLVKHEEQEIHLAALRGVEFLLEKLGCTLDSYMIDILRNVVIIYPKKKAIDIINEPLSHSPSEVFPPFDQSDNTDKTPKHQRKDAKSHDFEKSKGIKAQAIKVKNTLDLSFKASKRLIQVILDKYVSVLSSISSNILHQIFFDLLVKTLSDSKESNELKILLIKIAEKIISICQGDLILNKKWLESLLSFASLHNIESLGQAGASLWQSIRTKIMCNYSHKGMKDVIEWIAEQFFVLSEKDNIDEVDLQKLITLMDIISLVSVERLKIEEDTNNLIRLNTSLSMDLYLLLNPVIYWMKFSIEREDRLHLFKASWKTIKDIIMALPEGIDIDLISIILPIFERVCEFLNIHSPSLPMLKFLEIILQDVSFPTSVMRLFLKRLIPHIPYCVYDEIYNVFQIVLNILYYSEGGNKFIEKETLVLCLKSFTDKNTIKSTSYKKTVSEFVNQFILCLNTAFEHEDDELQMIEIFNSTVSFLIFNNKDISNNNDSKQVKELIELHTNYKDRIGFFIDIIQKFREIHINLFRELLINTYFHNFIFQLLKKGELELRIKSHEILEILSKCMSYITREDLMSDGISGSNSTNIESTHPKNRNDGRDVDIISPERLALIQLYYRVAKMSLETENDFYLQFSALILLDNIFQNLMPVPTFSNELYKRTNDIRVVQWPNSSIVDIENMTISDETKFDSNDPKYLAMRLSLVFKLWDHIHKALNSPWSNIRSICYGLICSMLKVDITDYNDQFLTKIKRLVLPLLVDLLSSRESESKAGGLNILGSLWGLSYDFTNPWYRINDNLDFFTRNTKFVSLPIWQYVFDLQEDWDITIKEASAVLIQLWAPRDSIKHFYKVKREGENLRLKVLLNNFSAGTPDVGSKSKLHQIMYYISNNSGDGSSVKSDRNIFQDASEYANQSRTSNNEEEKKFKEDSAKVPSSSSIYDEEVRAYNKADPRQEDDFSREEYLFDFYVDNYSDDKIKEIISIFRNDFKPPKNLWIENMNIQNTADANYFNDIFADDDNYNDSDNSPDVSDLSHHNEEIDDIGYNMPESDKNKKKIIKEEPKPKEQPKKEKKPEPKEESKYSDKIRPFVDIFDNTDEDPSKKQNKPEVKENKEPIPKQQKSKKKSPDSHGEKDLKVTKAKDGLNIIIPGQDDIDPKKVPKDEAILHEDFNKTRNIPKDFLENMHDDENSNPNDSQEQSQISIGKCQDEIDQKLKLIEEEKAKLEYERQSKRRSGEKKSSRSKVKTATAAPKSTREGYVQKKKRPNSHKKRGSTSNVHEQIKKKMGFINSHSSRGRGRDTFLNYSLDEINQKLQAKVRNYNTSTGHSKGGKKRLNKSFENVFSACASTSRAKGSKRNKKNKNPISSSPRRIAMKDKKNSSGHAKTPNTTSRKKLNSSLYSNRNNGYNMKEMADKLCLINFSSMPSTPTGSSFIKKLGEKMNIMKAEKEKMIYNFCKKQLSLTNPNMGALLKAITPHEKKVKNLKLKSGENYLNSSGILSSRNGKEDRIINSSRQNEHFSFGSSTNETKGKRNSKHKHREPMTERIR